jgi:hypothetical protein
MRDRVQPLLDNRQDNQRHPRPPDPKVPHEDTTAQSRRRRTDRHRSTGEELSHITWHRTTTRQCALLNPALIDQGPRCARLSGSAGPRCAAGRYAPGARRRSAGPLRRMTSGAIKMLRHAAYLQDLTDAEAGAVGRASARLALGLRAELEVDFVHTQLSAWPWRTFINTSSYGTPARQSPANGGRSGPTHHWATPRP